MKNRFAKECAINLSPYLPGEQPQDFGGIIKLNTNENPFPPSPAVIKAIQSFNLKSLRLYPRPESDDLKSTLANFHGILSECVFIGNGSDEVLAHIFCAFLSGERVAYPDVTYSFYKALSKLYSSDAKEFVLQGDFTFPPHESLSTSTHIIFPNPNAPTGISISVDYIEALVQREKDRLVIVDEAYIDFGGETAIPLTRMYDNIIVTRTFSKSHALAGMRIGYAVAHPILIETLNCVKNSFNCYPVSALGQLSGIESIKDFSHTRKCVDEIVVIRNRLIEMLSSIGFATLPSDANFIFTTNPYFSAEHILSELKLRNILVRYLPGPRTSNYLRITIGTQSDCDVLVSALHEITGHRGL